MNVTPPFDARSVANAVLSIARSRHIPVTQLSLQKIVYFVHGRSLTERGEPLVSGNFEAWPYGPVHPLIYESFKEFGSNPISNFATKRDILTGKTSPISAPDDVDIQNFILDTAVQYLKLSAGRLIDLSHAPRSAWDAATRCDEQTRKYGMRISNDEIKDRFKFHKVSISANPRIGEPDEESPPSRN